MTQFARYPLTSATSWVGFELNRHTVPAVPTWTMAALAVVAPTS